ncbi:M20/M25/M40 family metallo-hydrolase [Baekduia sp. Peel2402]|uniref:M20/M25/M40 family metallo-hydrolase n=1 Tax=Baekduia sp. Peel2402 TaxID=3458296 RepID=UPI00403E8E1F
MDLLDAAAVAATASELVRVPSVTGDERAVLERAAALASALGLEARLVEHDLDAVRGHPDFPGEEAPRTELLTLRVRAPSAVPAADRPRLALCGHLDVVGVGSEPWSYGGPWSGAIDGGFLHGRGSADMKGGVAAALHALAAVGGNTEVVLVSGEEDGGAGAFAALLEDLAFDGCVIPEPTGFDVVCAQAGALTFTGTVHGRAAHAAQRLHGVSAIDRYMSIHAALAELEASLNADVAHPLMAELPLPYPLVVGQLRAGEWSSSVPDRLVFEGRAPVRVGESPEAAREAVVEAIAAATPADGLAVEVEWTGGQFASAQTPADHPLARLALDAVAAHGPGVQAARVAGVPWGADMRLWCAAGVPTVMVGTHGIEVAHAVDERVSIEELGALARILAAIASSFAD